MDKSSEEDFSLPSLFDTVTVVNRSKTYHVSKQLICSSIPYFEKMFCCDLLESKENKVTLDLDENAFSSILNWVNSKSFVTKIENVLLLMDTADYLMIDDLKNRLLKFFRQNFTVEHIPSTIESANLCLGPLNLQMVNRFIENHFLKIIKTEVFIDYPFETVEHIYKLNLQIVSEYQVFESIAKWIDHAPASRKGHIFPLLKCIRWCHLTEDDLKRINNHAMFTFRNDYESVMCPSDSCKNDCGSIRAKSQLILIYEVNDQTIDMDVLDNTSAVESICGLFKRSDDLCIHQCTFTQCSDFIFDSGRKGIRVDWSQGKFRNLDMIGSDNSYYGQIYRSIIQFQSSESEKRLYLDDRCSLVPDSDPFEYAIALLQSEGRFNGIFSARESRLGYSSAAQKAQFYFASFHTRNIHSSIIKNKIFVVNGKDHIYCDLETPTSTKVEFPIVRDADRAVLDKEFAFEDLQLTCLGSKFYLINKTSKNIHVFDEHSLKWKPFGNIDCPHKLITLTTSYLPY